MSDKVGIKESKEALIGLFELILLLVERFRDGHGPMDWVKIFMAIQSDPRFVDAAAGIDKLPAEAVDYSIDEVFELLGLSADYVRKIVKMVLTGKV